MRELPDYIVWDFNGTVLDDVETGIRSVNHLLRERGMKTLDSREEYQRVFCFPIRHYYEKLGFDFEKESYEEIAPLWVEQYLRYVQDAPMFDDVCDTLAFFKERGVGQVILSATELQMLQEQIDSLGIGSFFEEIMGLDNIHAASKVSLAADWRRRHPSASVLLIGDTDHDLDTAREMQADCVLIARGHQSMESLERLHSWVLPDLKALRHEFLPSDATK